MSYLEALAQGLPLLCRADDALIGVLEHNSNGLIYHTREEYVDYACKLLSDNGLRKDMGQRSLQKVERFGSDVFASTMIGFYQTVIGTS